MNLEEVLDRGVPWSICTDVGASPTVSLLSEMVQFLKVHASAFASMSQYRCRAVLVQTLYRTTTAPAGICGFTHQPGYFDVGLPMSFVEVQIGELPPKCTVGTAFEGLLDLRDESIRSYWDGPHKAAIERLKAGGIDHGPELSLLEEDARRTAMKHEHRVLSVTISGREVYRRHPESS